MPSFDHPDSLTREDILLAARMCLPALHKVPEVTFLGDPRHEQLWENWTQSVFFAHIVPAIRKSMQHARLGHFREVAAVDRALDSSLLRPLASRSRSAGALVAAHPSLPEGERLLARYLAAQRNGVTPGHLAVVMAVRAAVFHLPEPLVLGAYLAAETKSLASPLAWQRISSCLTSLSEAPLCLRAA